MGVTSQGGLIAVDHAVRRLLARVLAIGSWLLGGRSAHSALCRWWWAVLDSGAPGALPGTAALQWLV